MACLDHLARSLGERLEDCIVPSVVHGVTNLPIRRDDTNGIVQLYSGRLIAQPFVQALEFSTLPAPAHLEAFVAVHCRLWRSGVGLATAAETWSLRGWSLDEHRRPRLLDLSCLTSDPAAVLRALGEAKRGRVLAAMLRPSDWPAPDPALVEAWHRGVSDNLNERALARLWKADVVPA
jgi:hypothetical protein